MKIWKQEDFDDVAFIAQSAEVMGDVELGKGCSIWHTAVIRGDLEKIVIGDYSNIQDGAILHGDPDQVTIVEDYVTVGHRAVIHSAYVKRGCLIGIGAIVLNGVTIGEGSIIGAGCVVTKDVEPYSLMMGIPARKVKEVTPIQAQDLIEHAHKYYHLALYHSGKSDQIKWGND